MTRPDPTILAFDTSAAHCAAALLMKGEIVGSRHEEMVRGQAERLFPMLEDLLSDVGTSWTALDAIGVGIGPGNFTGIRIAVSAARGLALSLEIPAVGVSLFTAARQSGAPSRDGMQWTEYLPAPRKAAYAQSFRNGRPEGASWVEEGFADDPASEHPMEVDWSGDTLAALAHEARRIYLKAGTILPPAPLYIRSADAAPASDPPPVILP